MNLGDFQEIEPIYNLEFDDFWKPQNLKSELQNVSSKYIVAKENGEIVGFAGILTIVDEANIMNIVTKKDKRT